MFHTALGSAHDAVASPARLARTPTGRDAAALAALTPWMIALTLAGCGGDGRNGSGGPSATTGDGGATSSQTGAKATGEGPCEASDECRGGVCVALIDGSHPPNYCTEECGACPAGFYCDQQTFSLLGLSFCRFGEITAGEPPPPAEQPPRLPCRSDSECPDGAVCATFQGERDCTTTCDGEEACTPPSLGGIVLDVATCGADETPGASRMVCLPDPRCFPDPTGCISGLPGF